MSNQHPVPFDLDQVLVLTGPVTAEYSDGTVFTLNPRNLPDPILIVEAIGNTGKRRYIEVTGESGVTYTIYESDFPQLAGTSATGERGLLHVIAQHQQGR